MAATPTGKGIPWHRVLGADGKLLIREPYASLQKKLLETEGIPVVESRINIKRYLWTAPKSTHIGRDNPPLSNKKAKRPGRRLPKS
jgi:hypothetical protein